MIDSVIKDGINLTLLCYCLFSFVALTLLVGLWERQLPVTNAVPTMHKVHILETQFLRNWPVKQTSKLVVFVVINKCICKFRILD